MKQKKKEKEENQRFFINMVGHKVEDSGWGYTQFHDAFGFAKSEVDSMINRMDRNVVKAVMIKIRKNEKEYQLKKDTPEFKLNALREKEQSLSSEVMAFEKKYQDERVKYCEKKAAMRELFVEIEKLEQETRKKKEDWEKLVAEANGFAATMNTIYADYCPKREELEKVREEIENLEKIVIKVVVVEEDNKKKFSFEDNLGNQIEEANFAEVLSELFLNDAAEKFSVEVVKLASRIEAIRRAKNFDNSKLEIICPEEFSQALKDFAEKTGLWPEAAIS